MNIFRSTALVAVLISGPALAADLPVYKAPPPPPPPVYGWTGCYLGVNAGYGWERDHGVRLDNGNANYPVGYSFDANHNGGLAGGQAGCDYQWNTVVVGVVASGDWAHLTGSVGEPGVLGTRLATNNKTIGSIVDVGGRIGVAWNAVMPYVKGGVAWMNLSNATSTVTVPGGAFVNSWSTNLTLTGAFVGVGAEYLVGHNLSAFVEYDYYNFSTTNYPTVVTATAFPAFGADPLGTVTNRSISANVGVIKAGLNYRFSYGPVYSKY